MLWWSLATLDINRAAYQKRLPSVINILLCEVTLIVIKPYLNASWTVTNI